jgi:hypothetical protein
MAINAIALSSRYSTFSPSLPPEPNLPAALPKPLSIAFGVFWGIFWAVDAHGVYSKNKELQDASPQKKAEAKKECMMQGISLGRTTAQAASFAHTMEWISLGKAASWVSGLASGATVLLSGSKIKQAYKDYQAANEKIEKGTQAEKDMAVHHKRCALLRLAEHVAYLAWAVLEIVGLVLGAALCPWVSGALLLGSLILGGIEIAYSWELKKWEKEAGLPSPA